MSDCLVIIDVEKTFINKFTRFIVPGIEELVKQVKFDHIVATKFVNKEGSIFQKVLDWEGALTEEQQKLDPRIEVLCERVFVKDTYSCFTREFVEWLRQNKVSTIYFAGIDLEACVLASAISCFDSRIVPKILAKYCASSVCNEPEPTLKIMEDMFGKDNVIKTFTVEK